MNKRGQGAIEYLSTYGWAILIVAIAILVLWQLGFFNPYGSESPGRYGFSVITPIEWKCSGSSLTLTMTSSKDVSGMSTGSGPCSPETISPGDYSYCGLMVECPDPGRKFEELVVITYVSDGVYHQSAGVVWGSAE